MHRLRRYAIIVLTIAVITSAIYATGAFSSLQSSRQANVNVAGDASGYLALEPAQNSKNSVYATYQNGKLRVSLNSMADAAGSGVNPGGKTTVNNVFTITNQGTQPVAVWLATDSGAVSFTRGTSGRAMETKGQAVRLAPGDPVSISIVVDTTNLESGGSLRPGMTVHASTDVAGTPVNSGGGNSDAGQTSPPPTESQQSQQHSKKTTDKQKSTDKDDGGGLLDGLSHAVNNPEETLNDAGEAITDFVVGSLKWFKNKAPGYIYQKLRNAATHPLQTIYQAGEQAWNFFLGVALGDLAMPSSKFPMDQAETLSYLGGWITGTIVPGLDVATGVRDFVSAAMKGDPAGMIIEAVGLVPGLGALENAKDLYRTPIKWAKAFPTAADEAFKLVSGPFLKNAPTEAKHLVLSAFGKGSDEAGTAAKNGDEGFKRSDSVSDSRLNELTTKYSEERIKRLVNKHGFITADIDDFAKRGVDLRKVEGLSQSGVSKGNIHTLTKANANLKVAYKLTSRGFSGDQLAYLAKHGEEAHPKITVSQAETLKDVGYSADDIIHISKNANSKYPVRIKRPIEGSVRNPLDGYKAQNPVATGATTEQLVKLRKQEIPTDDIRYYVDNGYSLKFVSYLKKSRSPKEVRRTIKKLRKTKYRTFLFGKCRDISASNGAANRTIELGEHSFKPPQKCIV
ncbi:DUF1102 domain-containing protein [Halocatena pleomorpha]|uniref:DUF1102 domain-containing protein n=1 Tax=Halocatena pleomorpha TaxID=1785090 RepID=A0A3P3RCQ9_9EURY|nr:DUF1102 domain-containing protein [Halocatena pleomorpha]RRJ30728.1 DUF1102 domain-containing protein [Halocatena pleomorpha]